MQGTLSRKQREIQQREGRILELARSMIVEQGYHGLSMDRIAEALEYSKGTIYQHFSCKEEVLMALVNQALERRLGLFRRAATLRGRPRERLVAVGLAAELFFQLYPDHFQVEHVIRLSSVQDKTSEERRGFLETCEASCMEIVSGVIRDAVACGDLTLPDGFGPESLAFSLWAITFGGNSIAASSPSLAKLGIQKPFDVIRSSCNALLDGFGWRPLSSELALPTLYGRIAAEVFSAEVAQLKNL
jgi:AcrR family transcriptional regulator